jgi:diguanylate cyclase (GGDEF)-like protein
VADEEGAEWRHRAFAPRSLGAASRRSWPVTMGVVGRATRTGCDQLVLEVARDGDYVALCDGVAAQFVVPIRYRGRILGAFDFEAGSADAFSEDNLAVFRMLADQMAGAIQLALLNRRLLAAREEVERFNRALSVANAALERQTRLDGLTGVANRRHFDETLDVEWRRAVRSGEPLSLVLVDIDCFKAYNDVCGHLQGDDCLRRVAAVLQGSLQRAGDLVARYGGEEFALVLPHLTEEAAATVAETLRSRVEDLAVPHRRSSVAPIVTISAGVATVVPRQGLGSAELIASADRALYLAKHGGRNRVCTAGRSAA